jgi:hypothetical protein
LEDVQAFAKELELKQGKKKKALLSRLENWRSKNTAQKTATDNVVKLQVK